MKINEEISRIKNLMGLNLLNEQYGEASDFAINLLKQLFGVSDDAAKKMGGNTESTLKQFVGGSGSYDDIVNYVAKSTGNTTKSIDNVVDWIKSQPEILDQLVKSSDDILKQAGQKVFANLKISNILDKPSIEIVDDLLTVTINKVRAKSIIGEIDDALVTLRNVIKTKGSNKNVEDLIKQLEDRKKLAQGIDNVTIKPIVGNTQKIDLNSLVEKWKTKLNCVSSTNCVDSQKILSELYGKLNGLPETFDPSNVKLGEWGNVKWVDEKGIQRERIVIEVTLPNNQKVLMYSSSGSNVGTTGKKAGEWFILPGFGSSGFFIKTQQSIDLTKGGNNYLTEFATYLEGNGFNNLGKKLDGSVKSVATNMLSGKRISNRSFVDQEQNINWGDVQNAKNMDDYNKLIAQAIQTGDYSYISSKGFEKFGIDNFRKFLINNIERVYDLDIPSGRWSVQFK